MILTIRFLPLLFRIHMRYYALSALELICGMLPRGFTPGFYMSRPWRYREHRQFNLGHYQTWVLPCFFINSRYSMASLMAGF